ncbi:MAG: tetratricopeptide repeat protein [Chloroflexi bacterium]|nr:tetratricopeptide repeat protein [Chloroflexota bacterium]
MSDGTEQTLTQAYELVEAGQLDEAKSLLDPVLTANPDDVDAWWIYVHAVRTPADARRGLENVLRLAPNYPGAADLMTALQDRYPERLVPAGAPRIRPIGTPPPEPPDLPDFANLGEPSLDALASEASAQPRSRSRLAPYIVVALILVVVAVIIGLLQGAGTTPPAPSPTAVAQAVDVTPTDDPGAAVTDEPTDIVLTATPTIQLTDTPVATDTVAPTETSTDVPSATMAATATTAVTATVPPPPIDLETVGSAVEQFPVVDNGIEAADSSFGTTLFTAVCATPGRELRTLMPQVMFALAEISPTVDAGFAAIGAHMIDCDNDQSLLQIAVDREAAVAFAAGDLSESDFQRAWVAQ